LVLFYYCPCFWFNYKNNIHLVLILSLLSFSLYISLFFPCLSGVKRLVALLLLCRISRTLSFLVYVWWWRAHAHKGLEYKPMTRTFTREFIVVIVIFVVVVCIYTYIYIYMSVCVCVKFHSIFSLLQWGVATWRVKFTFTLIIITCSFHISAINVIYLACIYIVGWKKKTKCVSMIIADYNNYHTIN
jgi:hypothetical protein